MTDSIASDRLVLLAKQGDRDAFEELYRLLKTSVWNWSYRGIGDADLAEEIVTETFIAMIHQIETLPDQLPLVAGWLRKVAQNKCCDVIRRNQLRRRSLEGMRLLAEGGETPDSLELDEVNQQIREAIDELPDEYQVAIQWRYLDELSLAQIGERLGLSTAATNSLLFRARKKLKKILAPKLNQDSGEYPAASSHGGRK